MAILAIALTLGILIGTHLILNYLIGERKGFGIYALVMVLAVVFCAGAWWMSLFLWNRDNGPDEALARKTMATLDANYIERKWTRSLRKVYVVTYKFMVAGNQYEGETILPNRPTQEKMEVKYDITNPSMNVLSEGKRPSSYLLAVIGFITLGFSLGIVTFALDSIQEWWSESRERRAHS